MVHQQRDSKIQQSSQILIQNVLKHQIRFAGNAHVYKSLANNMVIWVNDKYCLTMKFSI